MLPSTKGSDSALFLNFPDFFWGGLPCFQGQFPYIDIFSRTACEIEMKIGHKLPSTYSCVFQSFFSAIIKFPFLLVGFACS